jgi:hypothetical protein
VSDLGFGVGVGFGFGFAIVSFFCPPAPLV